MRKCISFFPFILFTVLCFIMQTEPARAKEIGRVKKLPLNLLKTTGMVNQSMINIGNFGYWFSHNGISAHNPYTGDQGGIYPRGTAGVIYTDGLLWGGMVRDPDPQKPQIRVGGNTFNNGTQPGSWGMNPNDERARIYRIRMDWAYLTHEQLEQEAVELFNVQSGKATKAMTEELAAQYRQDWKEWPVDLGAPYYDVNENGIYDPVLDDDGMPVIAEFDADGQLIAGGDYPGLANADQVLYFVVNDDNEEKTIGLNGSPPIGIELQTTAWAYNQPASSLGQIIFKRYKIINKSAFVIDSLYFSQWSDPDIGNYGNDLVGCDTTRNLMFAYNAYRNDNIFSNYNLAPPAVGYDFLQGPIVPSPGDTAIFNFSKLPGFKNLSMTSFYHHIYDYRPEPPIPGYDMTLRWYSSMMGFKPTVDLSDLKPLTVLTGPNAGQPTKFPLSGDPTKETSETADLDGYVHNPGDRRMSVSNGPITMQPGAAQEIIVAVLGGLGVDNLESLTSLQLNDFIAQLAYNTMFTSIPKGPPPPKVRVGMLEDKIILDWGWDEEAVKRTEGTYFGYSFEGYKIYQLPSATAQIGDKDVILLATYDKINGILVIESTFYSLEYRKLVTLPVQYGEDTGITRYFIVDKDYINNLPLYRGSTYYFAVSAYNYNEGLITDRSLESPLSVVTVTPQNPKPGYRYEGAVQQELRVTKEGNSDGEVQVVVVDPTSTTGHDYEIFFHVDADSASETAGQTFWGLYDKTLGDTLTKFQKQLPDFQTDDALTFDGLLIKVVGPPNSVRSFELVANGNGPLDPHATAATPWQGFPVPDPDFNIYPNMANGSFWFVHTWPNGSRASFEAFMDRTFEFTGGFGNPNGTGIQHLIPHDFEIRFTGNGKAFDSWNTGTVIDVPFELWDIGAADVPGDDYQLVPYLYDYDQNGVFNLMYDAIDPTAETGWADHEM